jgi:hypothetical protein
MRLLVRRVRTVCLNVNRGQLEFLRGAIDLDRPYIYQIEQKEEKALMWVDVSNLLNAAKAEWEGRSTLFGPPEGQVTL